MKRAKRGQIRKADIQRNLDCLEKWATGYDMAGISEDFVQWFRGQVGEIAERIRDQDYYFSIQSNIDHVHSVMKWHRKGCIVSVNKEGNSFTWVSSKGG